jgi:hypothetical protein
VIQSEIESPSRSVAIVGCAAPMDAIACLRTLPGAPGYRKESTDARICQYYYSFADFRSEDLVKSLESDPN